MNMSKKIFKFIYIFLMLFFLCMFIYSFSKVVNWKINNNKNRKTNNILHEYIEVGGKDKYNIDFDKIEEKNKDTIAYLRVFGTKIDYIVVKGTDNDYYLDHDFNKNNNKSGWIFADSSNKFDGTDKNIIIYGHNTIDKSMFGSLKNILDKEWKEKYKDKDIILVTRDGLQKYRVFSAYKIENEEYYIQTYFENDNAFKMFIKTISSRSNYNFNVSLDDISSILTLSTCANSGKSRVVLHAYKVDANI